MRELRVEDALLYLDQVKVEFGDRPHIYNEFLEIMKTFKTQQIDTPGVIRRVSNLFKGNRRLVLGFNTFLPEGYQIELPTDGDGPPVAVYRAPGSNVAQVLRESNESQAYSVGQQQKPPAQQAPPPQGHAPPLPPHAQAPAIHAASHGHAPMRHPPHHVPQHPAHTHSARMPQPGEPYGQKPIPPVQNHSQPAPQQPMMPRETAGVSNRSHSVEPPQRQGPQHPPAAVRRAAPKQAPAPQQAPAAVPPARDAKMPAGAGPAHGSPPPHVLSVNGSAPGPRRGAMPPPAGYSDAPPIPQQPPPQPAAVQAQPPMEFDHAINYVTTIKKRFASEPEIYKRFLEILHTYQKEQRGIKDVLEEVSKLFADHPDLLKEFTYFLPDAVQAQAKAQLEQVAKEAEARKRTQAKQAIMSTAQGMQKQAQNLARNRQPEFDRTIVKVPFGALQGRTEEQEQAIIRGAHFGVVSFNPVRPPKQNELTPIQAATKFGRPVAIPLLPKQPNTTEASFFQRAKEHLERKELRSERPVGSRRHTPYVEFLKCLHLYGAGIVNRDELLQLLKSLFLHGHAPKSGVSSGSNIATSVANDANDLLHELEEILIGRGPYAKQETALKDKSKYGALRPHDFDFASSDNPTPSYFSYPSDYPHSLFESNPGQSQLDSEVLNDELMCVGPANGKRKAISLEDYDGVRERHNAYEEMMFRIEDERYELDMAIERNVHALRQIEPFAEEVQALREQEEKDGQPIGRLQYRLNRYALNSIHINSIARIYGERGDEVLQHLVRNPLVVLPIVYQRLKQKDVEWRRVKTELTAKLNAACAFNYEGSLDVQCYFKRRDIERRAALSRLRDDCIRAKVYSKHLKKQHDYPAARPFAPSFALKHPDPTSLLLQPYASISCRLKISHKDAFSLVSQRISSDRNLPNLLRERIGRIWAEFVASWFNYPAYWIEREVRNSYRGTMSPNVVKFAPGQRVFTLYGEASIVSLIKGTDRDKIFKYRVKLTFGIAVLNPTAILYALPVREMPFVRRDGVMVRDEFLGDEMSDDRRLGERYQIMFATESIYMFMRLFSYLCMVLSDTREYIEKSSSPEDPAKHYYNPFRKESDADGFASKRLDYACVLASLKKVISGKMDLKEFEALGRKVSKEKVHQMAAVPKLVERCVSSLIKTAKEDALLQLYDHCRRIEPDLANIRGQCFAVAPDASYRIQYNRTNGEMCFCYVPKGEALLVTPPDDIKSFSDDEEMSGTNGAGANTTTMMDEDEEDPIDQYNSGDGGQPSWKKARLK